jgi:GGDEF domain-containing protein
LLGVIRPSNPPAIKDFAAGREEAIRLLDDRTRRVWIGIIDLDYLGTSNTIFGGKLTTLLKQKIVAIVNVHIGPYGFLYQSSTGDEFIIAHSIDSRLGKDEVRAILDAALADVRDEIEQYCVAEILRPTAEVIAALNQDSRVIGMGTHFNNTTTLMLFKADADGSAQEVLTEIIRNARQTAPEAAARPYTLKGRIVNGGRLIFSFRELGKADRFSYGVSVGMVCANALPDGEAMPAETLYEAAMVYAERALTEAKQGRKHQAVMVEDVAELPARSEEVELSPLKERDAAQLNELRPRPASSVYIDELTGLPNLRGRNELLKEMIGAGRANEVTLVWISPGYRGTYKGKDGRRTSVRRLKDINTVFGYKGGDQTIRLLAQEAEEVLPAASIQIFRGMSDSFCLICSTDSWRRHLEVLSRRFREKLREELQPELLVSVVRLSDVERLLPPEELSAEGLAHTALSKLDGLRKTL